MSVPPLRLGDNFDSYISGEVIIHPSAAIAPGVILQAAPNSKIIIGAGACIGMGAILTVDQGTLEIQTGANLGAGFLMVGQGTIGANACIGSATTVFNCSVESGKIIAPGSVLGDDSRHEMLPENTTPLIEQVQLLTGTQIEKVHISLELENQDYWDSEDNSVPTNPDSPILTQQPEENHSDNHPETSEEVSSAINPETTSESPTESANSFGAHIYGQGSIQRLLVTLFPHRQSFHSPNSEE
ncbi:transferase [Calothrix sp. 336/3]|uniref:transferase n=1 Tax=Calothrix sp. 336/3 TaxID=1337936 RepID=UPI0004E2EDF7|nr:transferase [Calothrix sp. 336/3]AKG22415.1 transferase [Calothrix sp. 336/3]